MCGIAGIVWNNDRPIDADAAVSRMERAIVHRGPDSDGRVSTQFADVGFRRLSIIDLAGGTQPLKNEDGTIECLLNGEIFNYLELREELIRRGHQLRTRSDTEVLPHLYEDHGAEMFGRLNGMFSICVVDHRKGEVLIARDHFGVKQMYYAPTPRGVAFGSELKAVLASGLVDPELDRDSILAYLTLFYCPAPHTLMRGVRKMAPGTFLRIGPRGTISEANYYSIEPKCISNGHAPPNPETAVLDMLQDAVRLQLQADVPVALSLSGGVDSMALLCVASRLHDANFSAITVSYPDTSPDEVSGARELCAKFNVRHRVIEPAAGDFLRELPELAWLADEPIADPALYSKWCIARAASQHVKVLLSGTGGDELFGGYGSYFLTWKRSFYAGLPRFIQSNAAWLCRAAGMSDEEIESLEAYRHSPFARHALCMSSLNRDTQDRIRESLPNSRDAYAGLRAAFEKYSKADPRNQQMLADLHTYLPDQVLPMMDRATMAASIEGRVPFLDVRLVELAFSLTSETKLGSPPAPKRLLRECLRRFIPDHILNRPKRGLPSPVGAFFSGAGAAVAGRLLLSSENHVAALVGRPLVTEWLREPAKNWRVLYSLLLLDVWHKLFIRDQVTERPNTTIDALYSASSPRLTQPQRGRANPNRLESTEVVGCPTSSEVGA